MIDKNESEIIVNWLTNDVPLLTVAVITYNQENYISNALDSILIQKTNFPFEIIIHDDCSVDNTVDILHEYAQKYPNIIKLILQKENQWSQGIKPEKFLFKKCLGKYIAICEGDDYWIDPNKLQIQLDEMSKFENCQMSFHSAIDKWEDHSRKDGITTKQADGNKLFSVSEIIRGGGGFCPTASLVFEKEAVVNLPAWYDKAPIGDYFLQTFGSLKGGALYIDRTMSVYRRNAEGSWSSGMLDVKMREKGFGKLIKTLDEMDSYFNDQFHSEITEVKSERYLVHGYIYLYNNYFKEFNQAVTQSYSLSEKKSKKLLLGYYLRNFPLLLKAIGKLNKFLAKG